MNKSPIFIIITILGLSNMVFCQTKPLFFVDKNTKEPVAFATVTTDSSRMYFLTDIDGKISFPLDVNNNLTWRISHLSYASGNFKTDYFLSHDTVYLKKKQYNIKEVTVSATTINYYKILNKLISKYRRKTDISKNKYAFYLETSVNNMIVEKIMAQLDVLYSHNSGFELQDDYVEFGSFWYNSMVTFLNLDTDKLILFFDPFSKKTTDTRYLLSSNSKIKKKHYKISVLPAEQGKKIRLTSKNGKEISEFYITANEQKIREIDYILNEPDDLGLLRINNDKKVKVNRLNIKYVFNDNDKIELILYSLDYMIGVAKTTVNGFFMKNNFHSSDSSIHLITGNYKPDDIYEQILFFAGSNKDKVNRLFNIAGYSEFNISDTSGLSSNNVDFRDKYFLLGVEQNKIKAWNKKRLDLSDFNVLITNKKYIRKGERIFSPVKNNFSTLWIFDIKQTENRFIVESMPSLMVGKQTLIVNGTQDTLEILLKANMVFDLNEMARKDIINNIQQLNASTYSLPDIKNKIKNSYTKYYNDYNEFLNKNTQRKVNPLQAVIFDSIIYQNLGVKNINLYFEKELNDIINDSNYFSINSRIIGMGYYLKNSDSIRAVTCFNKAIELTKIKIQYIKSCKKYDKRLLGIAYGSLAKLYYLTGNYDIYPYLSKFKRLFPEGYLYAKENIYDEGMLKIIAKSEKKSN